MSNKDEWYNDIMTVNLSKADKPYIEMYPSKKSIAAAKELVERLEEYYSHNQENKDSIVSGEVKAKKVIMRVQQPDPKSKFPKPKHVKSVVSLGPKE